MNKTLPVLLLLFLAGIGAAYLLHTPVSIDESDSSNTPSTALVDDPIAAGAAAGSLEDSTSGMELTRSELQSSDAETTGVAANLAPSRIDLHLVDRGGKPIAGATLTATEHSHQASPIGLPNTQSRNGRRFEASASTNHDGNVSLEVEPGIALKLEARGDFWAPSSFQLAALAAGEVINLGDMTLTAGDHFVGRVVDPRGKPLADATVGLEESGSSIMRSSAVSRHTTTDADGYFRIGGLPTGKYRVQARSAGYVAAELNPLIIPGTGRVVESTLVVTEGRVVQGTVVDLDGKPVAGAFVSPQLRLDSLGLSFGPEKFSAVDNSTETSVPRMQGAVETDRQGYFRLGGLDNQDIVLLVNADGYSTAHATIPPVGEKVLVRLQPRLGLSGTLLLPNGDPAAEVEISIKAHLQDNQDFGFDQLGANQVTTDAAGNFTFRNLSAGVYALSAYKTNAQVDAMPVQVFENVSGLTVEMIAAKHLIVIATSASGAVLADARVSVTRASGSEFDELVLNFDMEGSSSHVIIDGGDAVHGVTDSEGIAVLPGVVKGDRRITVEAEGYADLALEFVRNSGKQQLELVLHAAAALRATVKTTSGRPLSGVEVFLEPQFETGEELTQQSGAAGRVAWDDLRPGLYELGYREADAGGTGIVIMGMGGDEQSGDGDHKVNVVELVGRSTLEIEIVVDDMALPHVEVSRNGVAAGGVQVWLESSGSNPMMMGFGRERPVVTGADGVALLSPKEPGSYILVARAGNNAPQVRQEVEIHSGEASLRIEVLGAEVSGTLYANSQPVSGASLTLTTHQVPGEGGNRRSVSMSVVVVGGGGGSAMSMDSGNPNDATAVSDCDGVFRFTDVPAGTWVVQSRAAGFGKWESAPFSVGDGGEVNLGVHQLLPGASISGRDLAAKPRQGDGMFDMSGLLKLQDGKGHPVEMTMANPDGIYSFKDLPAGKYQIVRGSYKSEILELSAGQQLTFNLPKE